MTLRQLKLKLQLEWFRLRLAGTEDSLISRWEHKTVLHNGEAICGYLEYLQTAKSESFTSAYRTELNHTRTIVRVDLPVIEGIIKRLAERHARLRARIDELEAQLRT